jgi:hypothetical protein
MEAKELTELISIFKQLLEQSSDINGCLTELAKGRCDIMRQFENSCFNSNGGDINGVQSHYKAMKEQADKIDELILKISTLKDGL